MKIQRPSRYIDHEVNAVRREAFLKVALAFPDLYDVGMSHLGLKVLYDIINRLPYASAERVFHPWADMEEAMRSVREPIRSLEFNRPLGEFDIVGFSLQYELSYTSVLNMLDLGSVPLRAEEREDGHPLVIAGGPCTVNPMPMSPFIDAFLIGDGEEAVPRMLETVYAWKEGGGRRRGEVLEGLARLDGVYVPSVHGTVGEMRIRRQFIASLEGAPCPEAPVVPYAPIVHDRVNIEISRGCTRGCRFCQAGMVYRPLRERSPATVLRLAEAALRSTGYEEVAFTSLSAGDYSGLVPLLRGFNRKFADQKIAISLPSLRVKAVNEDVLREIRSVRKTGFTIAPEAASPRLRAVINKDLSEEDYARAVDTLFREGWKNLKLYFMLGLPTEQHEDVEAVVDLVNLAKSTARKHSKRHVNISVALSPFVPKPHTPFQWCGQEDMASIREKRELLYGRLKRVNLKGHDERTSMLEAVFSRGGVDTARLVEAAWRAGARLDGWSELFNEEAWRTAQEQTGLDAPSLAQRVFDHDEPLPWDMVDVGISRKFLKREYDRSIRAENTVDCSVGQCSACGLGCRSEGDTAKAAVQEDIRISGVAPQAPERKPIRVRGRFKKTGELRYLSHRELMTHMTRALLRVGVPIEYTHGFHPTPKLAFGPPLGVGIAGLCEYFDLEVRPLMPLPRMRERLNAALGEGVEVMDVVSIGFREPSLQSFISRYIYEVEGGDAERACAFTERTVYVVQRQKGAVDIRPMIEAVEEVSPGRVRLTLVDLKDKKVRLDEAVRAIFDKGAEELDITRVALFGQREGEWSAPLEGEEARWQAASL